MACDLPTLWQYWADLRFMDGTLCPFYDLLGAPETATLVFVPLGLALYLFTGSIILPAVLGSLVGAVVITQLPGVAAQPAVLAILLAFWFIATVFVIQTLRGRV